jgi:hypothetical protein
VRADDRPNSHTTALGDGELRQRQLRDERHDHGAGPDQQSTVSILEVRTGSFDNTANTGVSDGWFEKIKYTIVQNDLGMSGKKIFERSVNFKNRSPTVFTEVINLCKKGDEDDPPDDADQKPQPPCTLQIIPMTTIRRTTRSAARSRLSMAARFFRRPEASALTRTPRISRSMVPSRRAPRPSSWTTAAIRHRPPRSTA